MSDPYHEYEDRLLIEEHAAHPERFTRYTSMNITISITSKEARYLKSRLQNHESDEPEDPEHYLCRESLWSKIPATEPLVEGDTLDEDHPLWCVNEQIKDMLRGGGAVEDNEMVLHFLRDTGLPEGTVRRMHKAIVCAEKRESLRS